MSLFVLLLACTTPLGPLDPDDDAPADDSEAADSEPDDSEPADSETTDDSEPDDPVEPPAETCGNGQIDAGEACDPSVDAGGACGCLDDCTFPGPSQACDDGDPCTVDDACDGAGACAAAPMDCDDGDPCTTDTCDGGTCVNAGWDGDPMSLWDMTFLRDPSTLNPRVISSQTVLEGITLVEVQQIRYTSYESDGCEIRPIELEAYLARPAGGGGGRPGLAVAHGLGAYAEAGSASNPAAQLGAVVVAWSGPGQGQSEGTGSTPDHLFDVMDSPTDSWFWEHAVAEIRALSLLETQRDVDPDKLAITGYSGGAVIGLMVNGLDDRVVAATPVSGTGHLHLPATNPISPGWEVALLQSMTPPRDASSPEWQRYTASLDPRHYLPTAHGAVLLSNGMQDEFFPIDATAATFADLVATGGRHRLYSVLNWDHGWFALFSGEAAAVDIDRNFEVWMRYHLDLPRRVRALPPQPTLIDVIPGLCDGWPCAMAVVDLPNTPLDVVDAKIHVSTDGLTWGTAALDDGPFGWTGGLPLSDPATLNRGTAAWIAEFELRDGPLGTPIKISTAPSLPPGFHPTILAIAGPLPL